MRFRAHVPPPQLRPYVAVAHGYRVPAVRALAAGGRGPARVPAGALGGLAVDLAEIVGTAAERLVTRTVIRALHDTDYGSHQFDIRDADGNLWTVGTYRGAYPPTSENQPPRRPSLEA